MNNIEIKHSTIFSLFSNSDSITYQINHPINRYNHQTKLADKNGLNLIK